MASKVADRAAEIATVKVVVYVPALVAVETAAEEQAEVPEAEMVASVASVEKQAPVAVSPPIEVEAAPILNQAPPLVPCPGYPAAKA